MTAKAIAKILDTSVSIPMDNPSNLHEFLLLLIKDMVPIISIVSKYN